MLKSKSCLLGIVFCCFTLEAFVHGEVAIQSEGSPLTISGQSYKARIETDGCLTNLRVGAHEFLAPGVAISRGSYFFQGGPLKLSHIEHDVENNTVIASDDVASIRYEFGDSEMTWHLTNKSDTPLVFFLVLAKQLEAALDDEGKATAVPLNNSWTNAALVIGDSRLNIRGFDKLWGPWQGPHQVCQVSLEPKAKRILSFSVGTVSDDIRSQIRALAPRITEVNLQLYSPREYQVFQRQTASEGRIIISGHTTTAADEIRLVIAGDSVSGPLRETWQTLPIVKSTKSFSTEIALPAGGWYSLKVEARKQGKVLTESSVKAFGVGEVFVGAGQSNSTNSGEIRTQQKSGMVASFSGQEWQLADDPQPGVADKSQGGSFWPAFGDAMFERYKVPIGVAATGFGGTSVNQWQPDGDLFPWMMTRVYQLGPHGFRALLWHQGESDVEMSSDEYYEKLRTVILSSRFQAGWYFPWFVAQASYHNADRPRFESVRSAQSKLWQKGIALQGPDTDTLIGDRRDLGGAGIHFSPKGLFEHGRMWAESVGNYLDPVLNSKP